MTLLDSYLRELQYDIVENSSSEYINTISWLLKDRFQAKKILVIFLNQAIYRNATPDSSQLSQKLLGTIFNTQTATETLAIEDLHYFTSPIQLKKHDQIGVIAFAFDTPRNFSESEQLSVSQHTLLLSTYLTERVETRKLATIETNMLHRIVHDFKNPSMSISLAAEVLAKKQNDPQIVAKFADKIKKACERLVSQIDRIYDFANSDDSTFRPDFSDLEITVLFQKLKDRFRIIAEQKNQVINFEMSNLIVNVDPQRLYETLYELIDNALFFSQKDIWLSATANDEHYLITVADHGPGLTENEIEEAFKKYTTNPSTNQKGYTRGFGLSMVRTLTHLQKGALEIKSEKGLGSQFTLKLPKH